MLNNVTYLLCYFCTLNIFQAVKFVQPLTLPSNHQSEDDVSDRDLPELAPIEDYERAKICQQQQHQLKLNNQKHQKIGEKHAFKKGN